MQILSLDLHENKKHNNELFKLKNIYYKTYLDEEGKNVW